MGITRHPTKVHLSTRIATADERIEVAGTVLWTVAYTVTERGRESSFVTEHVSELAARRMVSNLLRDRLPGTARSDVYTEQLD